MSDLNAPWEYPGLETPEDFFPYASAGHWPHYTSVTISYSLSWSASETVYFPEVMEEGEVECEAQTRTNTSSGSVSGTITWTRQSEADETSEQNLAAGEFAMRLYFAGNASDSPRIDSAFFHEVLMGDPDSEFTGTWNQTLYTGNACEIIETPDSGDLTSSPYVDILGVLESGTGEWAKRLYGMGFDLSGYTPPIALPELQSVFLETLEGPPGGAAITFTDSQTLSTPDTGSWHGTASRSFTLTLS